MNNRWTENMYLCLALMTLQEVHGMSEWIEGESQKIQTLTDKVKKNLARDQIKIVENRSMRLKNDYEDDIAQHLSNVHWRAIDRGDFIPTIVDFNRDFYDIWSQGQRRKFSVLITYDSTSSGLSKRLVDPYKTNSPYGQGFCHNRNEVRKFRFDRIIDIKLTDKKFEKPKDWEKTLKEAENSRFEGLEDELY